MVGGGELAGGLGGRVVGWPGGWLVGWRGGRLASWPAGWLAGWLAGKRESGDRQRLFNSIVFYAGLKHIFNGLRAPRASRD